MAKPRVFISSTFYDLKQVRSSLEAFILGLGFDPVLSEKGSIAYSPDAPLDESCYREAEACDVFVLIIGGRYGSEVRGGGDANDKGFHDRYESITKREYESALQRDIPAYVLIEKSVYSEYETFKRNRENEEVKYGYVDSINIFLFIDYVLSRPRNSPVYHFELSSEIETWLREQWAGLFRDLIRTRTQRSQISSLADQIADLNNVSTTLKRYLEEVVSLVGNKEQAKEIIREEEVRLSTARELQEFGRLGIVGWLNNFFHIPVENSRVMFNKARSLNELAQLIEKESGGKLQAKHLVVGWRKVPKAVEHLNEAREFLDLPLLTFTKNDLTETASSTINVT